MFNEEQQKAIETIKGQLILVACPGSGKTTTLLGRIHEIKKMDHQQMDQFCQNLYKAGHADGMKDAEGLTESEVRDVILV